MEQRGTATRRPAYYDLKPGGAYQSTPNDGMREYAKQNGFPMPDTIVDGEVLEADPPRLLVQTWRLLMDPTTAAEPFTTLTYLIEESKTQPGVCKLTVTHDLADAPATATMVAGAARGGRGRRLGLGPQRPQVAARDGYGAQRPLAGGAAGPRGRAEATVPRMPVVDPRPGQRRAKRCSMSRIVPVAADRSYARSAMDSATTASMAPPMTIARVRASRSGR